MFSLEGLTALVTGGTRGIGASMAIALAEAGADIILVQRDTTNKTTHDSITSLPNRKCHIITADLSSPASVSAILPTVLSQNLNPTILLNCAGIQSRHPAHQFPDEDWNLVIQTNLTTVFTLCRDFGAHLLSLPNPPSPNVSRGSIINIGSLLTYQGGINVPAYAAAKGGIGSLTKALSNEWAKSGIKVNCIIPGYINTEMNSSLRANADRERQILERIPQARWGLPEDFKGPVVFLASEASAYVSGECLVVDGGWMGR